MIDEAQRRHERVNHEAAHCVAAWMLGHPVVEVDVDRPDDDTGGWVIFAPIDVTPRVLRERAVISRVAGLYTDVDWRDPRCSTDRTNVHVIAGWLDMPPHMLEFLVEYDAEKLTSLPRFRVAHDALCRYLAEHLREKTSGERVFEVCDTAMWTVADPDEAAVQAATV